jgi:hypothetical protein
VFYNYPVSGLNEDPLAVDGITVAPYQELGTQTEALLTARSVPEMSVAAERLRLTAFSVRDLFMRPPFSETCPRLAPSMLDSELRRMELAEHAMDVITAVDYLLSLLSAPAGISRHLALANEAGSCCQHGASDNDAVDRLTRRRLDARAIAVRMGMRLLARLRSESPTSRWLTG